MAGGAGLPPGTSCGAYALVCVSDRAEARLRGMHGEQHVCSARVTRRAVWGWASQAPRPRNRHQHVPPLSQRSAAHAHARARAVQPVRPHAWPLAGAGPHSAPVPPSEPRDGAKRT